MPHPARTATQSAIHLDAGFWSVVPSAIWASVVLIVLFWLRADIRSLIASLLSRIQDGSPLKLGVVEIGPGDGLVARQDEFSREDRDVGVREDEDRSFRNTRDAIYIESRNAMLVHRLQKSRTPGQLYDILIYVVPHFASLASLESVEYFFGKFWRHKIFPSRDRANGFPIVTSAYGPFLCVAKLNFNDGTSHVAYRYIDFEMGAVAPSAPRKDP